MSNQRVLKSQEKVLARKDLVLKQSVVTHLSFLGTIPDELLAKAEVEPVVGATIV